ncbi:hypothetical protein [Neogemmobacter tilapiae]|uniref:Uncharacterized protein n=1 Tax=Neogemmobacter tilapiae TaxID=875041 RepID=A0A918WIJ3_9RHOB|nr:hypothetical protein [Gemmobacter tilapiae]GHC49480.1 hypothetical protein GCM10007315_09560 [Gemmobacter tilapiae]
MKMALVWVDFNRSLGAGVFAFSKRDEAQDIDGRIVPIHAGLRVVAFDHDILEDGSKGLMVVPAVVCFNSEKEGPFTAYKWCVQTTGDYRWVTFQEACQIV